MKRRQFLLNGASRFGLLALALDRGGHWLTPDLQARPGFPEPHHTPRARSIIHLYMEGGPSQVDTFDYKPELDARAGEALPFKTPSTVFNSSNKIMPTPFEFSRHGQSGSWVSSLLPHIATCVDDLTFVHSMHHESSNHSAACYMTHTGNPVAGRPCMGSWISYGLGSINEELPGFVVLDCGQSPSGGRYTWSNGFLPPGFGGVKFIKGDTPIEFLEQFDTSKDLQHVKLDAIEKLNRSFGAGESSLLNYRYAASMQKRIPELVSLKGESRATRHLYGLDDPVTADFGNRCLVARRLVESGVRCIEVFSPKVKADRWDQHSELKQGHINNSAAVDKPIAGLIKDLKSRGLLDETIILWSGEFGRTPSSQGKNGRDHNPFGYTVFMAGGGFKPGVHHGTTDPFGYYAERDRVHLHDLHATLLHQLGIHHERLTFRSGGRDYRLTDVEGKLITPIIG